tara:strand:- start:251 stop:490 length:240 start_codon:yes stop_codon:yes gene_type:complete
MTESKDKELSLDELKDVSGGLKGGGGSVGRNSLQPEYSERLNAGGLGCNAGGYGSHGLKIGDNKGQRLSMGCDDDDTCR